MNEEPRKVPRSPARINTVVEYYASESEDMDDDDSSRHTPIPSMLGAACTSVPEKPISPGRNGSIASKTIAIELKVGTREDGARGVVEANSAEPQQDFLKGPVSLLTKADLMNMIQEGVRLGISETAKSNKIKVLKKIHFTANERLPAVSSEAAVSREPRKTMKYILHQYKAKNLEVLRKLSGITTEQFIDAVCNHELMGGFTEASGKSGSIFWYSSDRKYIMKSISQEESRLLQKISSQYTRYMATHPHTLLCRILGMFKIETTVAMPSLLRGSKRASRVRSNAVLTTRFVIMKNIFSECPSSGMDKFDLKGTTEDRFVRRVTGNEVLKDINFQNRWITLPVHLADCLNSVIEEDSEFLLRYGIMDYSIIVGILPADNEEGRQYLLDQVGGVTVETVVDEANEDKPLNIKEKLNVQFSKAAESVQKLFNPKGNVRAGSRPSSAAQSDDEEQDPADEPPTALTRRNKTPNRRIITSVFNSFKDGVIGLDEKGESPVIYYVGIIDILQQYTVKKKAAHFIKRCTIGCCHEIDTVAPSYYHARFVRYMQGKIQAIDPAIYESFTNRNQE
jgi:hypothetical protein